MSTEEGENAMIAANPAKIDRATASPVKYLGGVLLGHLTAIADRLDPAQFVRWFQDQARANQTKRELTLLSDYYLDDLGVRRSVDPRADDLARRLRIGG
jgi:uncharacterized protein YjiS (DUF1127 family)